MKKRRFPVGPAFLIMFIAVSKLLAIFFLLGVLGGELGEPFNLTQKLHPYISATLGVGLALLSVAGWVALSYYSRQKRKMHQIERLPLEKIESIGK